MRRPNDNMKHSDDSWKSNRSGKRRLEKLKKMHAKEKQQQHEELAVYEDLVEVYLDQHLGHRPG